MARPSASAPARLSPASGSITQLWLSTVPFLLVFLYFLYLASIRPDLLIYNLPEDLDDDEAIKQIYDDTGKIIGLINMVYTFLVALLLWSILGVYILVFIRKRQQLMAQYMNMTTRREVLGDVYYNEKSRRCCRFSDYATVKYVHPDSRELAEQKDEEDLSTKYIVKKRVRTYHAYTRERVTLIVLPGKPLSAQPKLDVEVDYASYTDASRDRIRDILHLVLFWIIFTLLSPVYVIYQMSKIYDEKEDDAWGWKVYFISVFGIIPLVAVGGNYARWLWHLKWVTNMGKVMKLSQKDEAYRPNEEVEHVNDIVCVDSVCGCNGEETYSPRGQEGENNEHSSTPYKLI